MSEKAKRWKRYSFLGRLKQAEITMQDLRKQDFVDEALLGQIKTVELELCYLVSQVKHAIKEHH